MKIRSKSRIGRIISYLLLIILLFIFSLHLYLKMNGSHIIKSYLEGILNKKGAIYNIDHNYLDFDLLGRQLVLKNLKISFNANQLKSSGVKTNMLVNATIPFLSITGISYIDLLLFKSIKADRIYLKNGELNLYILPGTQVKDKIKKQTVNIPLISFGGITIEDSDIKIFDSFNSEAKLGLKNLSADIGRIKYNSGISIRDNFEKEIPVFTLNTKSSFFVFKKTRYKVEAGQIRFSSSEQFVSFKKIRYAPSSSKSRREIILNKGSYHNFDISEVNLSNIDLKKLIIKSRIYANLLYINKPEIFIFRNRNVRRKMRRKEKKLPQQILRESGLKISLDNVRVKNGTIIYSEIAKGEKKAESILFSEIESSVNDISNYPEVLKKGRETVITLSGKLMGKSSITGKIIIPVNNRNNRFSFSGSLKRTDPAIFNNYLRRNARIRIDNGRLRFMNFSVNADNKKASGIMRLSYQNLRISLMKKNKPDKKSRFRTFLANTIIHRNNPVRKNRKLRTGKISFERKIKRSIFDYMWKCILDGIKSSIKI